MQIGAIIEEGPMDWQIFQQTNGTAVIRVSGRWTMAEGSTERAAVFVRIVQEETGETPAIDCGLSDTAHISAASNLVLGERLARVALKHLYGRASVCDAPDLETAVRTGPARIKLVFRHMSDRLFVYNQGAEELPITAEDELGFLHPVGFELAGPQAIVITFNREWNGTCRIHGAFEQNPKPFVPIDFASHLPMLSFYGVEVTKEETQA